MLILASASPRRRDLLRRITAQFSVVPSDVDEALDPGSVAQAVAAVARRKARAVGRAVGAGLVLAADTVVVVDGEVLGKPTGPAQARAMLHRLRGRAHDVLTGVALLDAATGRETFTTVRSRVLMACYTDATIEAYVASGAPLDKAGGYAIQDLGGHLVDGLVGSYSNVVGLPLDATRRFLSDFGVPLSDFPGLGARCEEARGEREHRARES